MDLNEMKELTKHLRAPAEAGGGSQTSAESLEGLIARLKEEDSRDRGRAHRTMGIFAILSIVYLVIFTLTFIFPPDGPSVGSRVALGLFTALFLGIALRSRRIWRALSAEDYRQPTSKYLRRTERRYRLFDMGELTILIPFLLLLAFAGGLAWMNGASRYLPGVPASAALAGFTLIFIVALLAGYYTRKREWRRRKAVIWNALKKLESELTRDEARLQ